MTVEAHNASVSLPPAPLGCDAEVALLRSQLARVPNGELAEPVPTHDDTTEWVLDYTDDVWDSTPSIGASAFARAWKRSGLLTAEEEVMFARRIEAAAFAQERLDAGSELRRTERRGLEHVVREGNEARERMLLSNIGLVGKTARTFVHRAGHGMQFDDLMQAGILGLMRAVDKFDCSQGTKFSTYATWWIKQSITRAIDDESRMIRLPVHVVDKCRTLDASRKRARLTWAETQASPHLLDTAFDAEHIARTRELLRPCLSLDQLAGELDIVDESADATGVVDDRVTFASVLSEISDHLAAVPGLGARAVAILEMRFGLTGGEPMTLDEIGQHFGVTRERIRQLEKKSLTALREHLCHPVE